MSDAAAASRSFVIFRLGDEEYGLPILSVSSIIRYEDATPVPRANDAIIGVINLRGRVIPVVDLGRRLGRGAFAPAFSSRIIVAEGSAGPIGVAVDVASEVVKFGEHEIAPVPDGVLTGDSARVFSGVIERDGSLIILVDLDEIVPKRDYAPLEESIEEEGSDV